MPLEMVDRLTAALDKAGVDYQAEAYPGTRHGWAVADMPVYQRETAMKDFRLVSWALPCKPCRHDTAPCHPAEHDAACLCSGRFRSVAAPSVSSGAA
jgi:dienelactone hydrolase